MCMGLKKIITFKKCQFKKKCFSIKSMINSDSSVWHFNIMTDANIHYD